MSRRMLMVASLLVTVLFAGAAQARAATITFDNTDSFGGTFTYDATTGIATVTGVDFDIIQVVGAPSGDATYDCVDCVLSMTTTVSSLEVGTLPGSVTAFFGDSGGSITMTGQVYQTAGNGGALVSSTNTVLSGSFVGDIANIFTYSSSTDNGTLNMAGTDSKDAGFIAALGLVNPFGFLSSTISLGGCVVDGNIITCDVTEADLANTGFPAEVVPEPASMMLLGTGLLGIGAAYRRRQRQRKA